MSNKSGNPSASPTRGGGPVRLTVLGSLGLVTPGIVVLDSTTSPPTLSLSNETEAKITVVLPGGVSKGGCVFHVGPKDQLDIPIDGGMQSLFEIPYWVFFSSVGTATRPDVHDFGVGGSPPTMVLEP